ncbi:IS5 family transposase [Streptomyces sp. NPDC001889]
MLLTDAQWARVDPLLPDRAPKRGGRWRDHREVIDSIAWKFQTGAQWVRLPEEYGNRRGVCNRLRRCSVDGTWERLFTALLDQVDADEGLNWVVSVDSTIVRARQHAAGARKRGPSWRAGRPCHRPVPRLPDHEDHLGADGNSRPLAFHLTAGQAGDAVCLRRRDRPSACPPTAWTAPNPVRGSPRGQGVLVTDHP